MNVSDNPRINKLLNCFDTATQSNLLDFCDRISKLQADIFIIMARKASCFFNCMEELGLIRFNGYVTSERILDMSTEWLKDKSVVIIDDAIVSGTTIFKTIKTLKAANVKDIAVHVLTINERWFQIDLLKDDNINYLYPDCTKRTDSKCIDLCYNLVNAILLQPRPYDIDFPLYIPIKVSKTKFNNIINNFGWSSYDVSSTVQKENDVFSLSVLPNQHTINRFSEKIGFNFNEECFLKIRIYGTFISKKKEMYEIRVVPMVILNKLSKEDINTLFDSLLKANDFYYLSEKFISNTSKLRLLQFYLSVKLSELWFDDISYILECSHNDCLKFCERNLSFLFPKSVIHDVELICRNNCRFNFSNIRIAKKTSVSKSNEIIDPITLKVELTKPFLDMYYAKEMPCRNLVKTLGKNVFLDDEYEELRQRLEHGITFAQLKEIVSPCSDLCDTYTMVSLFIDQAVDVGIAVPIIEDDGAYLSRAYRHGEDVLFGKREEILYSEMLYQFQEASNKTNGLTHLSVEKMIVLFTRVGLAKKILRPYISNFTLNPKDDNGQLCDILRVKTTLMGPVGMVGSVKEFRKNKSIPFITDESKSIWLTEIFKSLGYIRLNENNLYSIEKPDTSSVLDDYLFETQNFSYLLGELFNDDCDTGVSFSDEDIVKICSCSSLPTTIQSVAAEIALFTSSWHNLSLSGENMANDEIILKQFRNGLFFECINNAYMKVNAYDQREVECLIEKVHFPRKTDQNIWKSYFTSNMVFDISNVDDAALKNDLLKLYGEQRLWVLLVNVCIDLKFSSMLNNFNVVYNKKRFSAIDKRIAKIQECLLKLKPKYRLLYHIYGIKFEQLYNISVGIIEKLKKGISVAPKEIVPLMDIVNKAIRRSYFLQNKCCTLIGQHGKVNSVEVYSHCASISFRYTDDRDLHCKLSKIKNCIREYMSNDGVMILPESYSPSFYTDSNVKQVWIIARQTAGINYLTRICLNILYTLRNNAKIILFHDIGYPDAIKTSERTTSEFFCDAFYDFVEAFQKPYFLKIEQKSEFVYCVAKNRYGRHSFKKFFNSINANSYYDFISEQTICNLERIPFVNIKYQLKNLEENSGGIKMDKKNIGIITVLDEETKAVVEKLELTKLPHRLGQRIFYEGQLDGDNTIHKVVLTQQLSQGQESVILAYNDLINKYSPDMVFLVGIAGGIHSDLDYCDVVIADEIIGYDKHKDTPDGVLRRGSAHRIDAKLKPIIQSFRHTVLGEAVVASDNSKSDTINIFHENIGSGSAVIANELSEIKKWIHNFNDKTYAVEMEAFGFSTAFYETALSENQTVCGACVIRGISDLADSKKKRTNRYRFPAACNAAIVLKELVKHFPSF